MFDNIEPKSFQSLGLNFHWQQEFLLSLQEDGGQTELLDGLEFPSWDSGLTLGSKEGDGQDDGGDGNEDQV